MSIYSMDNTNNEIDFDVQEIDDISQTSGRDSHQMSSNQSGNNPNCNFTNMADGMGGPVWDSSAVYNMYDIVEWPANSGQFWQNTTAGSSEPTANSKWIGPCDCAEISEISGIVWDANTAYNPWQIVDHNGSIWIAQDAGANPGQEPVVGTDLWVMCEDSTPCDELIGMANIAVWSTTTLVSEGEIYQYPANSEHFYMVAPFIDNQTVGAPGVDLDAWDQEHCDCKDIWEDSGEPVWDSSTTYSVNSVVEHPSGTGDLWIAITPSTTAGVEPGQPWADGNQWELCGPEDNTSGGPCAGLDAVGVWNNSITPVIGDIYEFPANSGKYWEIIFDHNGTITDPESNGAEEFWAPVDCPCKETWVANGEPVWVSGTAYPGNYVVEHPANSGNLYIPLESGGVSVGAGEPGVDKHWVLCEGQEPNSGPCDELDYPVWNQTTVADVGDVYEYPANSGSYYQVTYTDAGGVITTKPGDDQDYEFWKPYSCPCKDTWVANGQPVWDSTITNYAGNYVVEWPAGSGNLYISEGGGLSNSVEPGTDGHWIPCEGNQDVEDEATPDKEKSEEDSIPSIGAFATLLGIIAASAFVRREHGSE